MAGRREDHRLLTGQGRFIADDLPSGVLHAAFARADRADVRLLAVDTDAARAMPGVVAVWLASDLGLADLPQDPLPRDGGLAAFHRPMPLLARDRLRHLGEPIALVLAEDAATARDAADLIGWQTAEDAEPQVIAFARHVGQPEAVAAALSASDHRVRCTTVVPRLIAAPLEPRGCLAVLQDGRLHLRSSSQSPHGVRKPLAMALGMDPEAVRISAGDVGGSFGLKGFLTREEVLVAEAARRAGQPVAWISTRSEAFLADHQGRGMRAEVTLGLDSDLRFTAVQAHLVLDAGAYVSARALGLINNIGGLCGLYQIPCAAAVIEGHTSNRAGIAPYRGHGRPEVTVALERAIDRAARELNCDRVDLRRLNLIPAAALPLRTPLGFTLDSGDFPAVLDRALTLADVAGAKSRATEAHRKGRLHGIGIITCVEAAGGPVRQPRPDHAILAVAASGQVSLSPGVMSTGQGHETTLTGLVASALDIPADRIIYQHGDSDLLRDGRGNGGSSGLAVSGPAVRRAVADLLDQARDKAASLLGCDANRLEVVSGGLRETGGNLQIGFAAIAEAMGGKLAARAAFTPLAATFPNGAHVCEIDIDPETGALTILRYTAVEDTGTVLSPVLVEGQMQGGIAQGLSQVMGERMIHAEDGQILTGSFMDYRMWRSSDRVPLRLASHPMPTSVNPLGVKGVGEAGTVGAVAALMSALDDALARAGISGFQMPATPGALWAAINGGPTGT